MTAVKVIGLGWEQQILVAFGRTSEDDKQKGNSNNKSNDDGQGDWGGG